MDDAASDGGGLLAAARRIGSSFVGLILTRVEIFGVELQEEKLRAFNLMAWLTVALGLGVAGILLSVGILGLFLWQRFGYAGVIPLAAAVLAGAAVVLWWIRRSITQGPEPFAATMAEIGKDLECLRARD